MSKTCPTNISLTRGEEVTYVYRSRRTNLIKGGCSTTEECDVVFGLYGQTIKMV